MALMMMKQEKQYVECTILRVGENVKCAMSQSSEKPRTPIGRRMKECIDEVWGSSTALARHLGMRDTTLSRYVAEGRLPAGKIMVRLAQALPGKIDYILTGRELSEVQELTGLLGQLSPDERDSVKAYARIAATRDPKFLRSLPADIKYVDELLTEARLMRQHSP